MLPCLVLVPALPADLWAGLWVVVVWAKLAEATCQATWGPLLWGPRACAPQEWAAPRAWAPRAWALQVCLVVADPPGAPRVWVWVREEVGVWVREEEGEEDLGVWGLRT